MNRRLTTALLALVAPALLLLTGCFSVESSIVVNEDGSGTQTMRLALPAELATSMGGELPTVEELQDEPELQALKDALGDQGSISFFSSAEEGFGFELSISVDASDDFGAALAARGEEMRAALPASDTTDMTSLMVMAQNAVTLRREGDEWIFEQESAIDPELMGELAGSSDMTGMASMFLAQSTITMKLHLPGEVTEHNADEVLEDGTLVWTSTGADAPRTLMARSDVPSGLPKVALIGLLVGGIALVALFLGFLVFGRRRA
ncbi:MAG: hypothetical protein KC461_11805 [Dehalococcoidia bacterium]|nr:hypothetical protein [Dehalococcoidia bacterium]